MGAYTKEELAKLTNDWLDAFLLSKMLSIANTIIPTLEECKEKESKEENLTYTERFILKYCPASDAERWRYLLAGIVSGGEEELIGIGPMVAPFLKKGNRLNA